MNVGGPERGPESAALHGRVGGVCGAVVLFAARERRR